MPGTPVIYYGDEIGMGDNFYLGDRDGVRTPMQWSPDRNGGFSRTDPQRLYLPPIMDPIYGYEVVNVESQVTDRSSLLNWMIRLLAVRKQRPAFGRGTMTFVYPRNRKILAYLREYEDDTVLAVFNLSRAAQAVELDLAAFKGRVPIELLGRSPFPPIGDLPYMLTLPAYGFYWFVLAKEAELPTWHEPVPESLPEFATIVVRDGWPGELSERARQRSSATCCRPICATSAGLPPRMHAGSTPPYPGRSRWTGRGSAGEGFLLTEVTALPMAPASRTAIFCPSTTCGASSISASARPICPTRWPRSAAGRASASSMMRPRAIPWPRRSSTTCAPAAPSTPTAPGSPFWARRASISCRSPRPPACAASAWSRATPR
jgi:hypothetical protein